MLIPKEISQAVQPIVREERYLPTVTFLSIPLIKKTNVCVRILSVRSNLQAAIQTLPDCTTLTGTEQTSAGEIPRPGHKNALLTCYEHTVSISLLGLPSRVASKDICRLIEGVLNFRVLFLFGSPP